MPKIMGLFVNYNKTVHDCVDVIRNRFSMQLRSWLSVEVS